MIHASFWLLFQTLDNHVNTSIALAAGICAAMIFGGGEDLASILGVSSTRPGSASQLLPEPTQIKAKAR
jgi:hypothetical protein